MATYQIAVYSPSEAILTNLGGGNYQVTLSATAIPTIITVNDTNTGANATIFNDGNPAVDGGAGWANPLQRFTATIDGNTYVNQTINPEWMFNVNSGEGSVFSLYRGDGGTNYGFGFTFEPTPGTTYSFSTSNGTLLPNIAADDIFVCFTKGTLIETIDGERLIEDLKAGDLVRTQNGGFKPLAWTGHREVFATGSAAPVRIKAGVFGNHSDLLVSQQHRMLLSGFKVQILFDTDDVLVAAKHLTDIQGVSLDNSHDTVIYYHLLFEDHEVIKANGAWSESFFPGSEGIDVLGADQREEIFHLFPDLKSMETSPAFAQPVLQKFEALALTRSVMANPVWV